MTRGLPAQDDRMSLVRWPVGWETTGEGGMAVFLVVPDDGEWRQCAVHRPTLECKDVLVNGRETEERLFPGSNRYSYYDKGAEVGDLTSVPLLACICLGTTGGAYHCEDGYFQATKLDLTRMGLYLYNMLRALYGREPELLTFLDT